MLALMLTVFVAGCNDDESSSFTSEGDFGNCSVTSFSINKNDKVLTGLDSVFFSIDLVNARIFNADSLPKGTDVSKLVIKIGGQWMRTDIPQTRHVKGHHYQLSGKSE